MAIALAAALLLAACEDDGSDTAGGGEELRLGTETTPAPEPRERTATATTPERAPVPPRPRAAARPPITRRPISFDATRLQQTAAYSERHYGRRITRLDPKVIVQHYTVIPSTDEVFTRFSANTRDPELHELPGVCSHFLVDRDGTIVQLVPERRICRHTVGLNHVAVGVEHVGASDAEVLGNRRQLDASLRLAAWLRCRYRIGLSDVIGHAESLSSPHHDERVPALRRQTHDDLKGPAMRQYRARLAKLGC